MFTETAVFDLLLPGDSRSLKQKRSYVRPILAMLKKYEVSAAEVGYHGMQFNAVVSTNTRAIGLWRSLGFDIVGTVPGAFRHAVHGPVDLHIMYREL